MSKRLLVIGSNKWTDDVRLHKELMDAWASLDPWLTDVTLVTRGTFAGAERMAEDIMEIAGAAVYHCPVPEMLRDGADLCLLFVLDRNHKATLDLIDQMDKARIIVKVIAP